MLFFLSVTWCSYRWCLQTTLHMVVCFHLFLEFLKQNKRESLYISYSQRNIMLHVMFLECFSSDRIFLAHSVRCLCSPGSEIVTGLRVGKVTAGLAESNGSLPPDLWLTSPARWLPRTGISSGTLRSAMEYGLPWPFYFVQKILILYNIEWRELSDIAQVGGHILSRLRWLSNATRIKWQQDNKAIAWMPSEKISPGTRKTWRSVGVQLQTTGGSGNSAGKTWRQQLKTGKEMACDGCGINRDLGQS